MVLDHHTSGDLELFRTRDGRPGIFQTLDRTKTPGGREALRSRFANPMSDADSITRVQDGIRFLLDQKIAFPLDPNHLLEVRQYLDSTWDVGSRAQGMRFLVESVLVSIRHRDLFQFALRGVGVTRHMLAELGSFLDGLDEKAPPSEVRDLLDAVRDLLDRLESGLAGGARRPWSVFKADRFFRLIRRPDLDRLFHLVSELDALLAMGKVMQELDLPFPEVVAGPGFLFEGEDLVHPFLKDPVGNPVSLDGSRKTLVFLTGPNMAGKTTYLKSVGVAAFLAHLGMGVPAARLRFSPLGGLYSSLSPEENLREGLSYFMAEVLRVRTIAEAVAVGEKTLVLVDEAFRGTNVRDAFDASLMVIRGFARSGQSGFIFASHLVELAGELEAEPRADFAFFDGRIQDGRASYDFRMKQGVSSQRFGLQLLDEAGVPQILDSVGLEQPGEES